MKDMSLIMVLGIFWFLLVFGVNAVVNDPLSTGSNVFITSNNSMQYENIDTTNFNFTTNDPTSTIKTPKSFLNTLGRLLTFRIPTISQMPKGVAFFISFLNWFLILTMGLLIYRLVRNGGG